MSAKKIEIDPTFAAATEAKDTAIKARAKANHSTAVVHISAQALAAAQAAAADHHLEADKAEAEAIRHAGLARKALEDSLGIVTHDKPHEPRDKSHDSPAPKPPEPPTA